MDTPLIFLFLIAAVAISSVLGFYRARSYGKIGILAWLQSMSITVPWLLLLGLIASGIILNFAGILLLLVSSTSLYIFLGRQVRAARQEQLTSQKPNSSTVSPANNQPTIETTDTRTSEAETTHQERGIEPPASVTSNASEKKSEAPKKVTPNPQFVPIPSEDLASIRTIFGIDTFFSTETIPYQNGAVFKGNLRGEPEQTYTQLSEALAEKLGDRYRLFLVEGPDGKPVVIVLPSSSDPEPMTQGQKGLAVLLAIATLATSLETGGILLGFDVFGDASRLPEVLPLAIGLLFILLFHELGHWVLARRYQVQISWPFLMPAWQIGSFGAVTRFTSLIPSRQALFDIALAGPALGGIVSCLMLLTGLFLSNPGGIFQLPAEFFRGSIFVGILARITLGSALQEPLVDIHPLVIVGWLGLVITALNLMPAGQLDGGRIVQSIYGRKTTRWTTVITLIILALASLATPLALYWAIIILFLQRELERPSLNELSEPDDTRAALGLLALFLMAAILLPLTPSLAGRLGIGG